MKKAKAKIKKVIKGLKKASKLHAGQAKTLKGVIGGKKLNKVAKALSKASKLHKKQSNIIKKHIKDMKHGGSKKGNR